MPSMDQTLAFAKQPGPAPNSPVSCSYSRLKLLKTLNSPWVSHPIFSLLSITSVHSCEESGPARRLPAYARSGKASQDNARSQEKFIRKPFLQALLLRLRLGVFAPLRFKNKEITLLR